jgi:hypothetical protein
MSSSIFHAYVYSLEAGSCSHQQTSQLPPPSNCFHLVVPSALAENALYFTTGCGSDLLMYDLATQEISAINPPVSLDAERCAIITMDTGRLDFATVRASSFLQDRIRSELINVTRKS